MTKKPVKNPSLSLAVQLKPLVAPFRVDGTSEFHLRSHHTAEKGGLDKDKGEKIIAANRKRLNDLQEKLYAQDRWSLLLIFQGMDAAGKDSAIKSVFDGVNPQGCQVTSFKQPSARELDHDFMWRCAVALPERGDIGIFNRSYYEECLVVRVHPEILAKEKLPARLVTKNIWRERFEDISAFERYLARNGTIVLKFFLNVSKEEQRKRFLDRLDQPAKNWKFSMADVTERALWDKYQAAYQEIVRHTVESRRALARGAGRSQMVRAGGDRLGDRQRARWARFEIPEGRCRLTGRIQAGAQSAGERGQEAGGGEEGDHRSQEVVRRAARKGGLGEAAPTDTCLAVAMGLAAPRP